MYTIYAIKSTTHDRIYVGMTNDLDRRLVEHNKGYNTSTKPYHPFILVYQEQVETRIYAREREKYWKSTTGRRQLKLLIP